MSSDFNKLRIDCTRCMALMVLLGLANVARAADETVSPMPTDPAVQQPSQDQPIVRDVWYAYEANGQRYGFEHLMVEKRGDGNIAYRVENRLLVDFLGQRQEITEQATFVVTATLEPVSLEKEAKLPSGSTRTRGGIEGADFVVVHQREELRREGRIPLAAKPLFVVCLDDWLRSQASATQPLRRQILDESLLDLEVAECCRKDAAGAAVLWDVNLGPEAGHGTIALGPDGIRTEASFRSPDVHLRRVSAEEAKNITYRVYRAGELLMFPVDRPIGPVQRLTALTLRLRWRGAGFEQLRLEDERQHVVETSTRDGETNVLVRIQPVADQPTAVAFPVAGNEFRPYLAEDRYIKPQDKRVAEQARAWIGDAKTASEAVRALSSGVFRYMQGGSLIADTLAAPEILECKQGKCSEFAILFASLARSAGIPTRIVLGMRIVSGSWVGHMWNEAYVGRWISVDSTTDEVGSAPALLKIVDSESVSGTQPVRWLASEAMHVSVEASAPPLPPDARLATGIDGSVYSNAQFACRLTAPHASWSIEDASKKGVPATVIRFKVPEHDDVLIHFVPIDVPAAITPGMLTGIRAARFKGMYQEFEILKDENYAVQTMTGRLLTFQRKGSDSESAKVKTTEVIWSDGTSCLLLNLIAGAEAHDEFAADFFKLLGSFEHLGDATARTP